MTELSNPDIHVLIIDDDDRIRQLLSDFLRTKNFVTTQARDSAAADHLIEVFNYDLLILDYMMPKESGVSFLTRLRTSSTVPVIMLTAKADLDDRLEGLSAGADDYLAKPFAPEELYLRIKAILKRQASLTPPPSARFGQMTFDISTLQLTGPNGRIHLTETEESLLASLINADGAVKTRDALATEFNAAPRSIDVLITRLRRKIEETPSEPQYIKTIRGIGYKFVNYV